ncbi:MAG TPA: MFS transporter [Chloroflexia bacterium]|nr:MFS transporter [Chloroflexia bacterium]
MNNSKNPQAYEVFLINQVVGSFLFTLVWTVQAVYYIVNAHLDPLQLVLLGTVLEGVIFIFEVPTGVVADTYSRRRSVLIGIFLWGIALLIEGSFANFWAILAAQVVAALGWTFNSGALEAWVAGEVGEENIGPVFLRASQVGRIARLSAIIASVGFASIQLNLPSIVAGVGFIMLGLYLVFAMKETGFKPIPKEEREGWRDMKRTFLDGTRVVKASPVLLIFLALGIFMGASSEGMDRLGEIHFLKNFSFPELGQLQPVVWFGIMDVGQLMLGLLATYLIIKRVDTNNHAIVARVLVVFSALQIVGIVSFALAGSFVFALLAYWGMRLFRGIAGPLYGTWLTQSIDPRVRATVLSMTSQSDAIGQVAGGPVIGWIGTAISIRAALVTSAVLLIPALPLMARARQRVVDASGADTNPAQVAEAQAIAVGSPAE